MSPKQPSKLFKCIRRTRRQHATSMRRWTYRGSEVVTDLVCEGDVRNRRWYVFAVVQEGDYTSVQRFHATPVVLQDEIALVLEVIVWVSWMRRERCYFRRGTVELVSLHSEQNLPRFSRKLRQHFLDLQSMPNPKFPSRSRGTWTCTIDRTRHSPLL